MTAGPENQATTGLRSLPISPWAGLGVLAVWAAAALLADPALPTVFSQRGMSGGRMCEGSMPPEFLVM